MQIFFKFSVVCGDFVRLFVEDLFGYLWRFCSVVCGGFVRLFVENFLNHIDLQLVISFRSLFA